MTETAASMVDVVYPLQGRVLPRDHRRALAEALERLVPWLSAFDNVMLGVVTQCMAEITVRPP